MSPCDDTILSCARLACASVVVARDTFSGHGGPGHHAAHEHRVGAALPGGGSVVGRTHFLERAADELENIRGDLSCDGAVCMDGDGCIGSSLEFFGAF